MDKENRTYISYPKRNVKTEEEILYDITQMWNLKKVKITGEESMLVVDRGVEERGTEKRWKGWTVTIVNNTVFDTLESRP